MTSTTAAATTRRAGHGRRMTLAALTLAVASLACAAAPTLAFGNNAPNTVLAGYGVTVSASVACDAATGTMTVSAAATSMQASQLLGPVAGPYDTGQSVRYNVLARELGEADWTEVYSWSSWQWIVSNVSVSSDMYLVVPQDLGTNSVTGAIGHNYEVMVQIDYWTGVENVVNVNPTYSQTLTLDPYNTYYLNPSYCHL